MSDTVSGLHTCKPGNAPSVGQVKSFMVQDMGNYIKIRSVTPDKGGQYYKILSAAKTDYADQHGNVSFNLEVEPALVPVHTAQNAPQTSVKADPGAFVAPGGSGQQSPAQESVKQHLMRAANLYALCVEAADTVIRDRMHRRNIDLHEQMPWFQAIATTLFIEAQRMGYVSHMPDREVKPKEIAPREDPF